MKFPQMPEMPKFSFDKEAAKDKAQQAFNSSKQFIAQTASTVGDTVAENPYATGAAGGAIALTAISAPVSAPALVVYGLYNTAVASAAAYGVKTLAKKQEKMEVDSIDLTNDAKQEEKVAKEVAKRDASPKRSKPASEKKAAPKKAAPKKAAAPKAVAKTAGSRRSPRRRS